MTHGRYDRCRHYLRGIREALGGYPRPFAGCAEPPPPLPVHVVAYYSASQKNDLLNLADLSKVINAIYDVRNAYVLHQISITCLLHFIRPEGCVSLTAGYVY